MRGLCCRPGSLEEAVARHQQNRKRAVRQIKVCSLVQFPVMPPLAASPQQHLACTSGAAALTSATALEDSMCLSLLQALHGTLAKTNSQATARFIELQQMKMELLQRQAALSPHASAYSSLVRAATVPTTSLLIFDPGACLRLEPECILWCSHQIVAQSVIMHGWSLHRSQPRPHITAAALCLVPSCAGQHALWPSRCSTTMPSAAEAPHHAATGALTQTGCSTWRGTTRSCRWLMPLTLGWCPVGV